MSKFENLFKKEIKIFFIYDYIFYLNIEILILIVYHITVPLTKEDIDYTNKQTYILHLYLNNVKII